MKNRYRAIAYTERHREIVEYIKYYQTNHDYAPTIDEIARYMVLSTGTILTLLREMKRKGIITFKPYVNRSLVLLKTEVAA